MGELLPAGSREVSAQNTYIGEEDITTEYYADNLYCRDFDGKKIWNGGYDLPLTFPFDIFHGEESLERNYKKGRGFLIFWKFIKVIYGGDCKNRLSLTKLCRLKIKFVEKKPKIMYNNIGNFWKQNIFY